MEAVQWRRLPRFPDYEVSEFGDVRRIRNAPPSYAGRILSGSKDALGRRSVHLRDAHGNDLSILVHRLVAAAFLGSCPHTVRTKDSLLCCHRDGDYQNNHYTNLYYGTQKQNMADRERHGNTPRGEKHGRAKLKAHQVIEIRRKYARGRCTMVGLAHDYGVSDSLIDMIVAGQCWRSVGGPIRAGGMP